MTDRCTGCGTIRTLEQIRAEHPTAISCCPERNMQPETWEVTVSVNGESVLTIGHNHLSGIANIREYEDAIRTCAQHLLAFVGDVHGECQDQPKEG